ncbi:microtubule-associated serine/threonine-protein kinase 3 [Lates japonicus]
MLRRSLTPPRRHTLEVPYYGEGDLLGDSEAEGACGGSYIGADHSRLGGYIGSQRMRDSGIERSEQLVVMRKLNLSERRDSFKKQEAVQEVSFDEPEEKTSTTVTVTTTAPGTQTQPQQHRTPWVVTRPQTSEEVELEVPAVRRFTLVPQIAVQGSTESEEQDEWEPCSDSEETTEKPELDVSVASSQQLQVGRQAMETTYTGPQVAPSLEKKDCREETPQKGQLRK